MTGKGSPAAVVVVKLDTKKASRDANKFNKGLSNSLGRGVSKTEDLQKSLKSVALGAASVGAALVAAGAAAVKSWSNVGLAIAEVQTIADPLFFSIDRITKESQKLAATYGKGTTEQVKALYTAISSGSTDAFGLLDIANKAAIGGLTSTEVAVDGITTILNSFQLEAGEAKSVADSMFTAVQAGKLRFEELSSAVGRTAAIAKEAGLSYQEMNSALATITTRGVNAAEAVTQLRSLLVAVAKPSKEAAETAALLGVNFSTSALQSMGYVDFLRNLSEATGNSQELLFSLLGRSEAVSAVLNQTADGGDKLNATLELTAENTGVVDRASARVNQTLSQQIDILKTRAGLLLENSGRFISGSETFSASVNLATEAVDGLNDSFQETQKDGMSFWESFDSAVAGYLKNQSFLLKTTKNNLSDLKDDLLGLSQFDREDMRLGNIAGAPFSMLGALSGAREIEGMQIQEGPSSLPAPLLRERAAARFPRPRFPGVQTRDNLVERMASTKESRAAERERLKEQAKTEKARAEREKKVEAKRKEEKRERDRIRRAEIRDTETGALDFDRRMAKIRQDERDQAAAKMMSADEKALDVRRAQADQLLAIEKRIAENEGQVLGERAERRMEIMRALVQSGEIGGKALIEQSQKQLEESERQAANLSRITSGLQDALGAGISGLVGDLVKGEFDLGKLLGGMLTQFGTMMVSMGSAAIAAQALSFIPLFAPAVGAPGMSAAAGLGMVAAGGALMAAGALLGSTSSSGSSSAPAPSPMPSGGSLGPTPDFDLGIDPRVPDSLDGRRFPGESGPVVNVFLSGPIGGSARAVADDLKAHLKGSDLQIAGA